MHYPVVDWELTPEHCRAARYLLRWRVRDLARHTGLSEQTVGRYESGEGGAQPRTIRDIKRALVDAGVVVVARTGEVQAHVQCTDGVVLAIEKAKGGSEPAR